MSHNKLSNFQFKLLFDALPIIRDGDEKEKVDKILERSVSNLTTLIQRWVNFPSYGKEFAILTNLLLH